MISFKCPLCQASLLTADANAGARGKCANCGGKIIIPQDATSAQGGGAAAPGPPAKRAGPIIEPATVRLIWGRVVGTLEKVDVLVDGVSVGSARPGRELEVPIAPGRHRLTVMSPSRRASKDFLAKPLGICQWRLQYGLAELSLLPAWQDPPARRPAIGKIGGFLVSLGGLAVVAGMLVGNVFRAGWAEGLGLPRMPVVTSLCFVLGGIVLVTGGALGMLARIRSRPCAVGGQGA